MTQTSAFDVAGLTTAGGSGGAGNRLPRVGVRGARLLTVADQALFSLVNFIVVILAANNSGAEAVGVIAMVLGLYNLAIGVAAGMAVEPGFVALTSAKGGEQIESSAVVSVGLAIGTVFGLLGLVVAGLVGADAVVSTALVAMPLLCAQNCLRTFAHRERRHLVAVGSEIIWIVVQVATFVVIRGLDHSTSDRPALAAWVVGGVAACAVLMVWLRAVPSPAALKRHLHEHGRSGLSFATEHFLNMGSYNAGIWLLALVGGLGTAGLLQVGQSFAGPVVIALAGLRLAGITEASNMAANGMRLREVRRAQRWTALVGVPLALAWAAVAYVDPFGIISRLFGSLGGEALNVAALVTAARSLNAMTLPNIGTLRIAGLNRQALNVRLIAAAVSVVAMVIGGWQFGATGAATGMLVGIAVMFVSSVSALQPHLESST